MNEGAQKLFNTSEVGMKPEATDWTVLHLSAKNGNFKVVKQLLDEGACVDTQISADKLSPLYLAAEYGHVNIVNILLENKANVGVKTEQGLTPLHIAVKNGYFDVAVALLDRNADVNATTLLNFTPLHYAAESGHTKIALTMMEKGADVNAQDASNFTPLHLAAHNDQVKVIHKLLDRGDIQINAQTSQGNTALHLACWNGHLNIVETLIEKNSNMNIENYEGKKALDLAATSEIQSYIKRQLFSRRPGTSGIGGQLYEIKLLILFLLQATSRKVSFHLATNLKGAGDFDDVVFKYKEKNDCETEKSKTIFLQAKYKEPTEKEKKFSVEQLLTDSAKGDFSLMKYFNSYRQIKQKFSEEEADEIFGGEFENSEFIIYTNATSDFSGTGESVEKINVADDDILNFERKKLEKNCFYKLLLGAKNEDNVSYLQYASRCKKLARELVKSIFVTKVLDINESVLRNYHIPLAELVIERRPKTNEGIIKENFLNSESDIEFKKAFYEEVQKQLGISQASEEELRLDLRDKKIKLPNGFGKINARKGKYPDSLPTDYVSSDYLQGEIEDFFRRLRLFFNQPGETELEDIIKRKIQSMFRVTAQDTDSVFANLEQKISKWWQSGEKYVTENDRILQDALRISFRFDVRDPVSLFTGRTKELKTLHATLQDKGEVVIPQMASVPGLGGVGKSELVRKYISEHAEYYDGNCIWINAASYQTIEESFRRLAQDKLRISTTDLTGKEKDLKTIVSDAYTFFAETHRRCLIVFDNAGKYNTYSEYDEGIDKFLSHDEDNKPFVIITSRYQEWGEIKSLPLGVFTEEEAIEFIRKALGIYDIEHDQDIKILAKELQYLPLALTQAVAYIKIESSRTGDSRSLIAISDYLDEYKKQTEKLLNLKLEEQYGQYTQTVYTTWTITIEKIKLEEVCSEQVLEILNAISYLAPDNIPLKLCSNLINDKKSLKRAVDLLYLYSLVTQGQGMLNVHRLVQQVTRINLRNASEDSVEINNVFDLLEESYPYDSNDVKDYPWKRQLLPHLEECFSHIDNWTGSCFLEEGITKDDYIERLLIWMGDGYGESGNFRRETELLERVLTLQEGCYGQNSIEIVSSLINLSTNYGKCCEYKKQKELLERALGIQLRHDDSNNVKVANILVNLGITYGNLTDYENQKKYLLQALEIETDHYGKTHFEVAKTLVNLGTCYGHTVELDKAMEVLQRALSILENQKGYENLMARVFMNLGTLCGNLGDFQNQKQHLKKALKIIKICYGPDHLEVADVSINLANAHGNLGNHEKKKDLLERALIIKKEIYGDNHLQIGRLFISLGNAYGSLNDHYKRKELLERALVIYERHYDHDYYEVAITLGNLGCAYGALGEHIKAKTLLEQALPGLKKQFGDEHFNVAKLSVNLSDSYGNLGDHLKQKELLEFALPILKRHYGDEHFEVAWRIGNLGIVHGYLGNYYKQKEVLQQALEIEEKIYGNDHYEVASTLVNLAAAHGYLGNHNEEKNLLERALSIFVNQDDRNSNEVQRTLKNLGIAYGHLGEFHKQKQVLKESLKIKESVYGPTHSEVAKTLVLLSDTCHHLEEFEEKRDVLAKALALYENLYGNDHCDLSRLLQNLGNTYGIMGNRQTQKELLERALSIDIQHYGPESFQIAETLRNLGCVYGTLNHHQKSMELIEQALYLSQQHFGPISYQVAIILTNLATTYKALAMLDKSIEILEQALPILKEQSASNFEVVSTLLELGDSYGALKHYEKAYQSYESAAKIDNQTPLHLTLYHSNMSLTENFIDRFPQCILERNDHCTVLHQMIMYGNDEVIRHLLNKIQETVPNRMMEYIDAPDGDGDTALMWAAESGKVKETETLIDYGANVNAKNKDGKSVLLWAADSNNWEVAVTLLKNNAKLTDLTDDQKQALIIHIRKTCINDYHDIMNLILSSTS